MVERFLGSGNLYAERADDIIRSATAGLTISLRGISAADAALLRQVAHPGAGPLRRYGSFLRDFVISLFNDFAS